MSVTLKEVIEAGGYDLNTYEDAICLLSKRREFEELVEKAEELSDTVPGRSKAHEEARIRGDESRIDLP